MLNAIIVVSVALFGVSAGAVLGARVRAGRRFPATPAVADIIALGVLFAAAYAIRLRVWGEWFHFAGWVASCMACGALAQWLKPRPQMTHGLTQ
jgi:hypothetical protein